MFMILFRFIFGGSIRFGAVPYGDFLISDQGFSDRLRSLPAPGIALLAGRALGDTGVVAWATAVTAAIGCALGFRLHDTAAQAFRCVRVRIGLVSRNAQAAQGFSMLAYPVMFVSSAYVRVNTRRDHADLRPPRRHPVSPFLLMSAPG